VGAVDAGRAAVQRGAVCRGAAQRTRELVLANPGLPMLVYMLACCECRAGHTQAAIEHLRVAVVSKRMRVIAAKDPELTALHDEPAFRS
jgi:hypothetical protein